MIITRRSTSLAIVAAALFASGLAPISSVPAEAATKIKCFGINSCAGHGGNNSCAGKGTVETTKAKCLAKGGKVVS